MPQQTLDKQAVVKVMNTILELELAGVARYTHYSIMVFGYNRIPIVSWLSGQASESLQHAYAAGEMITYLGEHPSRDIGPLLETHSHDFGDILRESLAHEQASLLSDHDLLNLAEGGRSGMLEEYARRMISQEEIHLGEVDKMLRKLGDVKSVMN